MNEEVLIVNEEVWNFSPKNVNRSTKVLGKEFSETFNL